jgi:dipeptidyl aminopeptidase/acylaminoacyl peptidase
VIFGLIGQFEVARADDAVKSLDEDLTLERLFPKKSVFGPSARAAAFSHDGRYAAYLYRPYDERRHGSDLWIYDTESGESERVTSVSVLCEFQAATREVAKDRLKKAKKTKKAGKTKDAADAGDAEGDPLSGTWTGVMRGGNGELELPPEGLPFTLTLTLGDDGSIAGTLRTAVNTSTITEANWNAEASRLTATLTEPESGLTGTMSVTVDGGSMSGTLAVEEMETELELTAQREAADDEEDDDGGDENGGTDTDEQDEGGEEDNGKDEKEDEDHDDDTDENGVDRRDVVGKKDAEDDDAPRYGGVTGFEWSPTSDELIFTSGGDLYEYRVAEESITRLTRTRERERGVQYLPDGSGYTYSRGGSIMRIAYGSHLIEQIDPDVPGGESLSGYRLSPDGNALVIVTNKGGGFGANGSTVTIVNYRGRFAKAREFSRHVSDEPWPEGWWTVYLYPLDDHLTEGTKPAKLYTHKRSGPRDQVDTPRWSPDSSRVAFSAYEQASRHQQILEARLPESAPEDEAGDASAEGAEDGDADETGDGGADDAGETKDESEDDDGNGIEEATVVYRYLHDGGPNTPGMVDPHYLADSRRLVFLTELTGYRHLHVLDPVYQQLDQLTRGRFEIYPIDVSRDHKTLFATATAEHPTRLDVYAIDLESGDMKRLNETEGTHSMVAVDPTGTRVMANYADFGSPTELVVSDGAGETKTLTDSHPPEAHALTEPAPEYFVYENRHGQEIHGHMFKPDDWTAEDERPLLIYVYGGPLGTRKMTTRGSFAGASYSFAYYMAKKHGYVTCTIDPRGVSGFGGLFEKSNFEQVGKPQVEDLVDGAKWFVEHQGVDEKRVGLHGWSFGGFQTQMCLYTEPDVFACGIAGAGPTEWENYNVWYSTATIGKTREGKTDLAAYSLLPLAKNLKGKLLLVHGMEDSNVLYQDTVRVYRELLKAEKETLVELFLDPTGGHGLGGDVKTVNRYRKYEEFLTRVLGSEGGETSDESDESDEADDPDHAAVSEAGDDG